MRPGAPAKHCGILIETGPAPTFIHAYEHAGVVIHPYSEPWARRARFAFLFPG